MGSKKTVVEFKNINNTCFITANTLEGGMNFDWYLQVSGVLLCFAYSAVNFTES